MNLELPILAHEQSPPPFQWEQWYKSIGGRNINIPEVQHYIHAIFNEQYPAMEGMPAPVQQILPPDIAAQSIKEKALQLGADLVGICAIEPQDIYQGKQVNERYAIALGQKMRWQPFQTVPSDEAAIECLRIYHSLGDIVLKLAEHIRSLGWHCTVEHPIGDTNVLHIPIALKAGFGELGRHGSIINPRIGPLFRIGCILTSIPLALDAPINAGIAQFCDNCKACRIYCPADAIPDERNPLAGKDHLGNDRYTVDTGKCFPYFGTHQYCSACLPVCAYNHKEWAFEPNAPTELFPTIAIAPPPPPTDAVPDDKKHPYPHLRRQEPNPWEMKRSKKFIKNGIHG